MLLRSTSVVAAVGVVLKIVSPSTTERLVWVPVSAAIAVLAWRLPAGRSEERPAPTLPG